MCPRGSLSWPVPGRVSGVISTGVQLVLRGAGFLGSRPLEAEGTYLALGRQLRPQVAGRAVVDPMAHQRVSIEGRSCPQPPV